MLNKNKIFAFFKSVCIVSSIVLLISIFTVNTFANSDINGTSTKNVDKKVTLISNEIYITLSNVLYITDGTGYLNNVVVSVKNRGNLPAYYEDPVLYRYAKNRLSSIEIQIQAEIYTDLKENKTPISHIVKYNVDSGSNIFY